MNFLLSLADVHLAKGVLLFPAIGLIVLTFANFTRYRESEIFVSRIVFWCLLLSFFCGISSFDQLFFSPFTAEEVARIQLLSIDQHAFYLSCRIDGLSFPFVFLTTVIGLLVALFSTQYLHRDPGHFRFFYFLLMFVLGCLVIFTADTFESIFIGWEFVGLTSALLIAFFFTRRETFENALKAFWTYRITDVGLLLSALLVSTFAEGTHFTPISLHQLQGNFYHQELPNIIAVLVPLLCLLAAMGKSSQVPFCHWLPRAMEGPTPSSAIFYGALSVHAGVYLMLRVLCEFEVSGLVYGLLIFVGLSTAIYATFLGKLQSDIKSGLAYSSMTQVGVMFVELGLGLRELVIFHCIGHAILRSYQLLSASSSLEEHIEFRDVVEDETSRTMPFPLSRLSPAFQAKAFSFFLESSLNGSFLGTDLMSTLHRVSRKLVAIEEHWVRTVAHIGAGPKANSPKRPNETTGRWYRDNNSQWRRS